MERLNKLLSWFVALLIFSVLFFIIGDISYEAITKIDLNFLLNSPASSGRRGGIYPIIISTLLILMVSMSIVLPLGMTCALYLSNSKRLTLVRSLIEVLAGVPSIVFGLFGNALFSIYFGLGFSILSGGMTLALMSLPLFITTVERGIRSIPKRYYAVGDSLGMSQLTILRYIVLPYIVPAITVGLVLSVGRSLAETAALIFTSGYVDRMPESLFDSGRSLSIHIYDLTMNVPGGDKNAYKASFVLIVMIILINILLNYLLKKWQRKRAHNEF